MMSVLEVSWFVVLPPIPSHSIQCRLVRSPISRVPVRHVFPVAELFIVEGATKLPHWIGLEASQAFCGPEAPFDKLLDEQPA